jgi:two-component system cell cycle sensor histidine kinase/response regulator CckA
MTDKTRHSPHTAASAAERSGRGSPHEQAGSFDPSSDSTGDSESSREVRELRRYAGEMERLFNELPEAVAVLSGDDRVIRINPAFSSIFGYTAAEAQGQRLTELIVPEQEREAASEIDRRILAGERATADAIRRRKDGSLVHVSMVGTAIRLEGGEMGVYGIYRDVMAQKRAESERATAEAHYRRLFESAPVGIYTIDDEGKFTELNPAAEIMLGRSAADLVGRHFSEVVAPEDMEAARTLTRQLYVEGLDMCESDLHIVRPDGQRRLLHLNVSPVRAGEVVSGAHGLVRDATEERARDRYMHRAEQLATMGTLLSGVAHELNNPLNAIRNFAQLMLLDRRPDEDREALEIVMAEADRAAKIVADLRTIARQTRDDSDREPVDVNEMVKHVLKLRRYTLGTNNISVVERLAPDLPPVWANRGELEQAVLNVVLNAEEALAGQRGRRTIEIRTRQVPSGVQLQLEDSGPGIPEEHLERVFDPFWTTKAPGEGTGLGLSLVYRIVTDHGGDVRVRSDPGSGAVFTVLLPTTPVADAEADEELADEPPRPLRVLLVDDERALRNSIARYLRRRGHRVDEAQDGAAALAMISRTPDYDVILTDLRMPGLSGEQLLERLKSTGLGLHRQVVVITGDAAHADAARIVEATGAPTLIKPVKLHDVARAVEQHADRPPTTD